MHRAIEEAREKGGGGGIEMENAKRKGRESTLIHLFGFCLFIRQVSLMKL